MLNILKKNQFIEWNIKYFIIKLVNIENFEISGINDSVMDPFINKCAIIYYKTYLLVKFAT